MLSYSISVRRSWQFKTWHGFILLLLCEWLLSWHYQMNILTRDAYYHLYGERLELQRIDDLFDMIKRFSVWGYAAMPIVVWLRIAFVTLLLQLPLVFRFIDIPFREIFRIVLTASFLLLLMELVKLVYLSGFPPAALTKQELAYVPFALINWLNTAQHSSSAISFLSHFSLFELGWLAALYHGLVRTNRLKKIDAGLVVLVLWMFLIVMQWSILIYVEKLNS